MHIIVPMSGVGKRFMEAGYVVPKPLIVIDGKPVIQHVAELFPGETKFTFICNQEHLANTNMRQVLLKIAPACTIVEIAAHKLGPVHAVLQAEDLIDDDEEVIVNYCDFGTYWDYHDFLRHTRNRNADGAIPSYRGFHPHMLGSTNYAFMRDNEQWMIEINEKKPFTNNRMQEYASNGTYYFKKGAFVKKYFRRLIERNLNLGGEFYVSLVYNLLVEDGLKVSIYEIQHMLQWGTPGDVEEYNTWSAYFRNILQKPKAYAAAQNSTLLIPLAGKGNRFVVAGYADPKPLIPVSGKPMIIQAAGYLPKHEKSVFVCLADHLEKYPLRKAINDVYPDAQIVTVQGVTEGQAITCSLGLKNVDANASLLIAATDNGMVYDVDKYQALLEDENVDAIVWTFRHHQSSKNNPQMYGWVQTDDGKRATGVSVKKPISKDPFNDHAIVGTFYFRKVGYFNDALRQLIRDDIRVNGEFYVDSMIGELIKMRLNVQIFEVSDYIGWGTPDDLKTFEYWQSFFHKSKDHPYSMEKDPTVNSASVAELDKKYTRFEQEFN